MGGIRAFLPPSRFVHASQSPRGVRKKRPFWSPLRIGGGEKRPSDRRKLGPAAYFLSSFAVTDKGEGFLQHSSPGHWRNSLVIICSLRLASWLAQLSRISQFQLIGFYYPSLCVEQKMAFADAKCAAARVEDFFRFLVGP